MRHIQDYLEDLEAIAEEKNGRLLSTTYISAKNKLEFECVFGHKWSATPNNIKNGQWCPECNRRKKGTIEDMQLLAQKNGGECISTAYIDQYTPLTWRCAQEHVWTARPNNIKSGTWCPICRRIQRDRSYQRNKILDKLHVVAQKHGGQCLATEYIDKDTPMQWQCSKGHTWVATPQQIQRGRWCTACRHTLPSLDDAKSVADYHQGYCLSTAYKNPLHYLEWQCSQGHRWYAQYKATKEKRWCPICKRAPRSPLRQMRYLAQQRGGKCLSKSWNGDEKKLEWQCKQGHMWKAVPGDIKHGSWCPKCKAHHRQLLSQAKTLAKQYGGRCLSSHHYDNPHKLLWECANGHQWLATIQRAESWCPHCEQTTDLLQHLQHLAAQRNGQLLDKTYCGATFHYTWLCDKGHIWQALPHSIRSGSWCRECYCEQLRKKKEPAK